MKKSFSKTPTSKPAEAAEVEPQDGLMVTSEEEAEVETEDRVDPLPSVPVEEPVVQAPAPVASGMSYLGTASMDGMRGKGGSQRAASLPVVVKAADGRIVGVVVVGDPGDIGAPLAKSLEDAGHPGAPFQLVQALALDRATKLAAAKAVAAQQDPLLDRVSALMALGFTPESLS